MRAARSRKRWASSRVKLANAAQATFPPEVVVREGGDAVEVDGVDGDGAAAVERAEGCDDDGAGGGERDGGVEQFGRRVVVAARPLGAERARSLALRSGACAHARSMNAILAATTGTAG
jgi:hypothetical protein